MQHGLISNLHITNAKQHFAHTIRQTWQSGVKKKNVQTSFRECDKWLFLLLYVFHGPFNQAN